MLNFCTLFNSNYLSRGMAMYYSLEQHCTHFHLYIFAFDDHCYNTLRALNLKHATIVSLKEFENEQLLAVKSERTPREYCWTCASSTIKHCIETYRLDHCSYVDADLLFFSDPRVLYNEMGDKSVMITEHRFTPHHDQSATSGIYCVQFMTFKNTEAGMEVLNWWVNACIEWCYCRFEDGKFGDQKYLDNWAERFDTVHVLQHLGGGVAPWNVEQYTFSKKSGKIKGEELATGKSFDLVFYHYHAFQYTRNNTYKLTFENYFLSKQLIYKVYKPYVKALTAAQKKIKQANTTAISYEVTNDIEWINRVIGRSITLTLLGYYKNFYKERFTSYGLFN
ncbi:glycosyl transferase [Pedobacter sp.]|uniref:glycosyl transferase n=1 Tax=Pedobacter sp. TaxID=1411316 RepID=UPI0031CEDDC6